MCTVLCASREGLCQAVQQRSSLRAPLCARGQGPAPGGLPGSSSRWLTNVAGRGGHDPSQFHSLGGGILRGSQAPSVTVRVGSSYTSVCVASPASLKKKFFFNVYLFLRRRATEHEQGRSRERERETQNPKQAPGSELSAQRLTWGSNSRIARSPPEMKPEA